MKTTTAQIRDSRNKCIVSEFIGRFNKGDQITPLIEDIAENNDVKYSTAYKVIKKYRDSQFKQG